MSTKNKKRIPSVVLLLSMQHFAKLSVAMRITSVPSFAMTSFAKSAPLRGVSRIPSDSRSRVPFRCTGSSCDGGALRTKTAFARFCLGIVLGLSHTVPCPAGAAVTECAYPSNRPHQLASPADGTVCWNPLAFNMPQETSIIPTGIQRWTDQFEAGRLQAADEKAARIREYDEMFKKDARERDEYYGKMALESMKKAEKLKSDQQQELKAFRDILNIGDNTPIGEQPLAVQIKVRQEQESQEKILTGRELIEEIKDLRDQERFESRMNAIDRYEMRKSNK